MHSSNVYESFEFPEDTRNYLQDYGIDFDDHEHPIKAFNCCCGSGFCRDKKQKGQSDNLILIVLSHVRI